MKNKRVLRSHAIEQGTKGIGNDEHVHDTTKI